jgi:hypothetical protein
VRRDLNFESENRFNSVSVISCRREVVDALIGSPLHSELEPDGVWLQMDFSQTVGLKSRSINLQRGACPPLSCPPLR